MIVVSNTSPLTSLAAIGQFDLLRRMFGQLHIADGVLQELHAGGVRWPGYDEASSVSWIRCHEVQNRALVTSLRRDVDRGEAETIALGASRTSLAAVVPQARLEGAVRELHRRFFEEESS